MTARTPTADLAAGRALAELLILAGYSTDSLPELDPEMWAWAATAAGLTEPPTAGTRRAAEVVLRERERHPDPFDFVPPVAHGPRMHGPRSVS